MPVKMPDLLPCPLCPGVKPVHVRKCPPFNYHMVFVISGMPGISLDVFGYKTERGARNAWNRLMLKMKGK